MGAVTPHTIAYVIDDLGYVNIHTAMWSGGEIRCQFVTSQVIAGDGQTNREQSN